MLIFSHESISKSLLLLLLLINTLWPCYTAQNSPPECPYPCLPPPIGGSTVNNYPPPPQLTDSSYWYPPPPPLGTNPGVVNNYPPPASGSVPNYYLSPPYNTYPAPPPPNPIIPWFPFYYKYPPPPQGSSAHRSNAVSGATLVTSIMVALLGFVLAC